MKKVKRLILNEDFKCWKKGTIFVEYVFEKNSIIEENTASIYHDFDFFTDKDLKVSELELIQNDPDLNHEQKQEKLKRKSFKDRFEKAASKDLEECFYFKCLVNPIRSKISKLEEELKELNIKLKDLEKYL